MKKYILYLIIITVVILSGCKKPAEDNPPVADHGHISFGFTHHVNGSPLQKDTMIYVNAAGNPYEIDQLMYFISDITLYRSDGSTVTLTDRNNIHYVDLEIPSTLTWNVTDEIRTGSYDSLSFIFGFTQARNISNMFVNPPESNMQWPDLLGGGYHYMMLNGKWRDSIAQIENFNFHLGIGQLYKSNVINIDSIYAFVQNYFRVSLQPSSFSVSKDNTTHIELIMNIESWFSTPHNFDFNYWGGNIMQIQPAMQEVKENGFDVFEIGTVQ